MEVAGKHVVITGAASGIGRATALRLRRKGRGVVVSDLDADGAAAARPNSTQNEVIGRLWGL